MSIRWISSAWQQALSGEFGLGQRVYVDFRQIEYPEIAGVPTFTLITSADNQPGSHNFTGGYANYLLDMPSKMTLDIYFKPNFSYTGGSNQYLWSWYIDATHYLAVYFDVTAHVYTLSWQDGGTARTQVSGAYGSDGAFQIWTRLTVALDLTTGTSSGSTLYVQGASVSTTWSGASDTKSRYFPVLEIRGQNGSAGSYTINYARLFSGIVCSATDVANNFWIKGTGNPSLATSAGARLEEEVIWHYNGHAVGRTRCNVTGRVRHTEIQKTVESGAGQSNENSASVILQSIVGQFADDQYAAFAPASEIYNGISAQKYMQAHTGLELETWYNGLFELEFSGRVDDSLWTRKSVIDDVSVVTITANDRWVDFKKAIASMGYYFENYDLSKPSDNTTSLLHTIARLVTYKTWYNYLGNSSFENATIASSWLVAGTGATFTKAAGGIIGASEGDLAYGSAAASVYQVVTFTNVNTKRLDTQQNWNFSIYLKSSAVATGTLRISGYTGASTETEFFTTSYSLAGGEGWKKFEVSYTIATATVDRIRCTVTKNETGTLAMDCAMLVQKLASINFFILNSNDGTTGVITADSAMSGGYNSMGFDVDDAPITHPWMIINLNDNFATHLADISDATAAYYLGMDSCNTMKFRTPFKAGYADPTSLLTISALQEVDSVIDINQANHIIIHGIWIVKDTTVVLIWNAKDSGSFNTVSGADIYEQVLAGAQWPNPAALPQYWATYKTDV